MKRSTIISTLLYLIVGTGIAGAQIRELELSTAQDFTLTVKSVTASPRQQAAPRGEWKELGTGQWSEDLFTYFGFINAGTSWDVLIEESESTPGWYRLLPYGPGSPVATYLGDDDSSNYVYIDARNEDKVYMLEFKAFGTYLFSHHVEENGWYDDYRYATLTDGVISFPQESVCYRAPGTEGWPRTCRSGKLALILPGARTRDYSLSVSSPLCPDEDGSVMLTIESGADVSEIYTILLRGEYSTGGSNAAAVVAVGTKTTEKHLAFSPSDRSLYSFLVVGTDDMGNIVNSTETYFFGTTDTDEWEYGGTAVMVEGFFAPLYQNVSAESLNMKFEENLTQPGMIRLVNPYAEHSFGSVDHSPAHDHYIYIDARSYDAVLLEASPAGINLGYGDAAVWSWAGRYVEAGDASTPFNEGLFGTKTGNYISFPDNSLLVSEKEFGTGAFGTTGKNLSVMLLPTTGIEDVETEEVEAAEFYTLQGLRLTEKPTQSGIYLMRKIGGEASKFVVH